MRINIKVKIVHDNPLPMEFMFTIDENNILTPLNPEDRILNANDFNLVLGKVLSIKGLMERSNITKIEIEKE